MAKLPHTRAAMRVFYTFWQVAELAAGYRYTTRNSAASQSEPVPVWRLPRWLIVLAIPWNILKRNTQPNLLTFLWFSDSMMLTVFRAVAHNLLPMCYLERGGVAKATFTARW